MTALVLTWERQPGGSWRLREPDTPNARGFTVAHTERKGRRWVGYFARQLFWIETRSSLATRRALEREIDKRSIALLGVDVVTFETRA